MFEIKDSSKVKDINQKTIMQVNNVNTYINHAVNILVWVAVYDEMFYQSAKPKRSWFKVFE